MFSSDEHDNDGVWENNDKNDVVHHEDHNDRINFEGREKKAYTFKSCTFDKIFFGDRIQ